MSSRELIVPAVDTTALAAMVSSSSPSAATLQKVGDAVVATVTQATAISSVVVADAPKIASDSFVAHALPNARQEVATLAPALQRLQQVCNGLSALAQIHPVVGIVASALTALFQLELMRRQNNNKAVALCNQIADTVAILQQLQKVNDEGGLKSILISIADHIRSCEEFITLYTTKGTILRILKARDYVGKMKALAETFDQDKSLLGEALSRCAVIGIQAANNKLDEQSSKLSDILAILTERSSEDIAASRFAQRHGVELSQIPESDNLLRRLALEMKDQTTNVVQLRDQLSSSLDELLAKNRDAFLTAFDEQSKQMSEGFDMILTAVEKGPWMLVEHPDMRQLWRQERWKGSVPRNVFMEALSSFYTDIFTRYPTAAGSISATWINSQHWAAMAESIDVDESGYVAIHELNTFCLAMPPDWTLPSWFAFSGVGNAMRMKHDSMVAEQLLKKLKAIAEDEGPNQVPLQRFIQKISPNIPAIGRGWCWLLNSSSFALPEDESEDEEEAEEGDEEAEAESVVSDVSDDSLKSLNDEADDQEQNQQSSLHEEVLGELVKEYMETRDRKILAWLKCHDWRMTGQNYEDLRSNEPSDTNYGALNAIVKIVLQELYDQLTSDPKREIPVSRFLAMRYTLKTVFWQYRDASSTLYHQWCNQRKEPMNEARFYCNGLLREWMARQHKVQRTYFELDPDVADETDNDVDEEVAAENEKAEAEAAAAVAANADSSLAPAAENDVVGTTNDMVPSICVSVAESDARATAASEFLSPLKARPTVAKSRDIRALQAETYALSARLGRIEELITGLANDQRRSLEIIRPPVPEKEGKKGFKWSRVLG
ncbi:hypothetical protein HDU87_003891 [Geranomyces variabilis]|uniref:EF-hand domain-containing protein n=1 Tax=Geranomyces variabilis TaxID=109894 RepID=A0AAD5TRB2_9FUNG|nr:hypothetical protein HDU87_003891 [Geranomyces variabilis]